MVVKVRNPASVQSIERGLSILEALSCEVEGLGITALARRTNLPVSTVHRLLSVFVKRGYILRGCQGRSYRLKTGILGLGLLPASLFCEVYQIICKQFAARINGGDVDEVFVKIASHSFSVKADRKSTASGAFLVPELRDGSVSCDGAEGIDGCLRVGPAHEEALYRLDTIERIQCICLPINSGGFGNGGDRIGAGGLGRFSQGKVVSILSDIETAREKIELKDDQDFAS